MAVRAANWPLRGGPQNASKAELALRRVAQSDTALLSIRLQAEDVAVYRPAEADGMVSRLQQELVVCLV